MAIEKLGCDPRRGHPQSGAHHRHPELRRTTTLEVHHTVRTTCVHALVAKWRITSTRLKSRPRCDRAARSAGRALAMADRRRPTVTAAARDEQNRTLRAFARLRAVGHAGRMYYQPEPAVRRDGVGADGVATGFPVRRSADLARCTRQQYASNRFPGDHRARATTRRATIFPHRPHRPVQASDTDSIGIVDVAFDHGAVIRGRVPRPATFCVTGRWLAVASESPSVRAVQVWPFRWPHCFQQRRHAAGTCHARKAAPRRPAY